ncbi:MAG: NAD(P)H-dependent oxidoreductase [Cyanobacteria bacterium J06636_16]
MKILVCVFHPNIAKSRVNQCWIQAISNDPQITVHEVYGSYPDKIFNLQAEQQRVETHDRIVFQHPLQWYSVPPLMKQWLDEVLAYGAGRTALVGKEWLSAISTGGTAKSYQLGGSNGYGIGEFLKPLQQTAVLTGMEFLSPFIFYGALQASTKDIQTSAKRFHHYIKDPNLNARIQRQQLLELMS